MSDYKTSILVNRQVPEFVREEHPIFISFLEAYYEFLEQKQGTKNNDLLKKSKDLRYLSDVDDSIDEFEENFFNTYASFVSKDVAVTKESLIKNVLPLYLSKGSENSFKLLFRMLFGQELEIKYPKNDVLRASDGKWQRDKIIKVTKDVSTYYTGDGTKKEFYLLQSANTNEVSVYFNGVLQVSGYVVRSEIKKIVFTTAPANGVNIEVFYTNNIETELFNNRKITGQTSGATALIENTEIETINNEQIVEYYINPKTVVGNFTIGETLLTDIIAEDGSLIRIRARSFSSILSISIIDGGANYNVGDPVPIVVPSYEREPKAFISRTFSGKINQVQVRDGGAGFQVAANVRAVGIPEEELFFAVGSINSTGANSSNSFIIYSNIISDVDPANTLISASAYNLVGNSIPNVNVTTVLSQAFGNVAYSTIGEISNVQVLLSELAVVTTPTLNAEPAYVVISNAGYTTTNTTVTIDTFGSLGKMRIIDGGLNYEVGDEIQFNNRPMSFGLGAEAEVMNVSSFGKITEVKFLPPKITGTANVTSASNVMVQGNGTAFTSELKIGDKIYINGNTKTVVVIASDTSLNVNTAFGQSFTEKKIRNWNKNLLGGYGYKQDKLPTTTVITANGSGANIAVTAIMGDGEDLFARGSGRAGEIEEITIIDPGKGIRTAPQIVLTAFGDGTAEANATINPTLQELPGRWTSSDSILSASERRLQGRDFYINYSYLLSSEVEFAKYKKIFKELLHPAGFKSYAELNKLNELGANNVVMNTLTAPKNIRTISGTVNVNSTIFVVGTGTKFATAANLGLITANSYIAVNSEIRMVNSIISETLLTVSSAFTITANNEEVVVMNTEYDAIATEITLDEIIAENELVLTVES
jgi:hypothetical protein